MLTFVRTCNTSACYANFLGWVGWGWGMLTFVRTCNTSACYVTSWVGWCGVGMLTFLRTCNTCACYVTSWVGWGGDVDVRENLQHIRMLRNFLGWVGWGGDVDVRENLQHIRMLRITSWVGWGGVGMLTFVRTCDTSACYVASWVGFWFAQVEWIQCGNCLNQQFPVALRPGWTAMSILNWCEASGFGNGVGWTPKKMFWRKLVACWTSACAAEREKFARVFSTKILVIYRPWC